MRVAEKDGFREGGALRPRDARRILFRSLKSFQLLRCFKSFLIHFEIIGSFFAAQSMALLLLLATAAASECRDATCTGGSNFLRLGGDVACLHLSSSTQAHRDSKQWQARA